MNSKTIYTILTVMVIASLGYYFINNQPPTNQLPINNNTDTPTTTEPVQNEPGDTAPPVVNEGYTSYSNQSLGVSFNYPETYTISESSKGSIITLKDKNANIVVYVNPSDFGPPHNNIRYHLAYNYGTLEIVNIVTDIQCGSCDTDNVDRIWALIQTNKDKYFFMATYPKNNQAKSDDLKNLIESFRF